MILETNKKAYEVMFFWYVKVYIFWKFIQYFLYIDSKYKHYKNFLMANKH